MGHTYWNLVCSGIYDLWSKGTFIGFKVEDTKLVIISSIPEVAIGVYLVDFIFIRLKWVKINILKLIFFFIPSHPLFLSSFSIFYFKSFSGKYVITRTHYKFIKLSFLTNHLALPWILSYFTLGTWFSKMRAIKWRKYVGLFLLNLLLCLYLCFGIVLPILFPINEIRNTEHEEGDTNQPAYLTQAIPPIILWPVYNHFWHMSWLSTLFWLVGFSVILHINHLGRVLYLGCIEGGLSSVHRT